MRAPGISARALHLAFPRPTDDVARDRPDLVKSVLTGLERGRHGPVANLARTVEHLLAATETSTRV